MSGRASQCQINLGAVRTVLCISHSSCQSEGSESGSHARRFRRAANAAINCAVAPSHPVLPLLQRQHCAPLLLYCLHQLGRPRIMLPPFCTHRGVGWTELRRVTRDSTPRVQVDRLERADDGPAQTEAIAHDAVDVLDGCDAIAHQAIGLTQHCALQAIEHEPGNLLAYDDRRQTDRRQDAARALSDARLGKCSGNHFDDAQQEWRISRMCNQAAVRAGQPLRELRDGQRRRCACQDGVRSGAGVELRKDLALQLYLLRRTFLNVVGWRSSVAQRIEHAYARAHFCFGRDCKLE